MTFRFRKSLFFLLLTLVCSLASTAQPARPRIEYAVSTAKLANHRLEVSASFPADVFPGDQRELALAVWTPGSYKIRDYSRFLGELRVLNSGARVRKSAKNRWLIEGVSPDETIRVEYSVYGHELTVRTNYFTPELSLIVGAATFVSPAPLISQTSRDTDFQVAFTNWDGAVSTTLSPIGKTTYRATGYDQLADSPILLGDLDTHTFRVGDRPHDLVQAGDRQYWDIDKSLKDTERLVQTIQEFWGTVPYQRYIFQNLITDTRGGLEHKDCTVVMTGRYATEDRSAYVGWLSLLAHEYFHTWNVKRLRPESLGPFDYEKEVYTPSLWVAEGVTSYYDDLLVRRAGLSTRKEYLKALSGQLNQLLNTPGRHSISLGEASFDAWIRLYQASDDLHNSNISYYNKGAIVAWLLDTEIRRRSRGKKSLDDLMRLAYSRFSADGFSEQEFRQLASEVAGSDLDEFFELSLDGTSELPIEEALDFWNLEWLPEKKNVVPYLGVELDENGDRALVTKVYAASPAAQAGIAPGDELIAIDERRVPAQKPLSTLEYLKVDENSHTFLLSRLGRIQTREVVLTSPPHRKSELKFGKADGRSKRLWNDWLGPEREAGE